MPLRHSDRKPMVDGYPLHAVGGVYAVFAVDKNLEKLCGEKTRLMLLFGSSFTIHSLTVTKTVTKKDSMYIIKYSELICHEGEQYGRISKELFWRRMKLFVMYAAGCKRKIRYKTT